MIKRITAMTAALILIFAVGTNQKTNIENCGKPIAKAEIETKSEKTAIHSAKTEIENSKIKVYEPIKPKEVEHEGTDEIRKTYDSGDAGRSRPGGAENAIEDVAGGDGCNRDGTVLAVIGADEGDLVVAEGIPSDCEGYSDGTEGTEPDAEADYSGNEGTQPDSEADGGQDEVVTDPEPEPIPEPAPEPEPAVEEPQMEYLGDWVATGYCPAECCCGSWAWGATASGVMPTANHTVACNSLPFGTQLMIDGTVYTVEDTGWSPYGDAWVDIFFDTHDQALVWGERIVSVYLVR